MVTFAVGDRVRQTLAHHRPPLIREGVVQECTLCRAHAGDPAPPRYPHYRVAFDHCPVTRGPAEAWAFPEHLELLGREMGPLFGGGV